MIYQFVILLLGVNIKLDDAFTNFTHHRPRCVSDVLNSKRTDGSMKVYNSVIADDMANAWTPKRGWSVTRPNEHQHLAQHHLQVVDLIISIVAQCIVHVQFD